ncbi:MFS transporter [Fodinicola feengrottensis]|uniref:MFS transporter n=1 Tax=Fodinicola feengrottensis TaxID=435914 RepID=A0ABN2ICF1_9ACTN|nr:MFS transporter [Fodinicola feengrottensis]
MQALLAYKRLPALAGAGFLPIAFLARLPLAMAQLGTLLLVVSVTGSYAAGGLAAGLVAVGMAVGGPVVSLLADRHGQRPVALLTTPVNALVTVALVIAVNTHAGMVAVGLLALGTGLSTTQIGALARSRWIGLAAGRSSDLAPAMSYESAADETSFALGPALIGLLAAVFSPSTGLLLGAATMLVFGPLFALHPTAAAAGKSSAGRTQGRVKVPELAILVGAMFLLGCFFGGVGAGVTALSTAVGAASAAGGVIAVMGLTSAAAGLATPLLPERLGHPRRLLIFAVGLAILSPLLLAVSTVAGAVVVVVAVGCCIAPYMISVYSLGERLGGTGRTAAVMTLLSSGVAVGYAAGSTGAGALADLGGFRLAMAAPAVAMAVAAVLVFAARGRLSGLETKTGDTMPVRISSPSSV